MLTPKQRTTQQRKSLEVWCKELAREAQDKGVSYRHVIQMIDIDWTQESVKAMVRSVGKAMYKKNSTADLTTIELIEARNIVDKAFLEHGIKIDFPSFEEQEFTKYYSNHK